ncbi:hypothetical protein [Microbacterium sp. KR10-403]|uniref:hypothetical protein n=1 Tax=Microbacterium sp. KR10-403 TaxID=3158581 RepID=UPI0032E42B87
MTEEIKTLTREYGDPYSLGDDDELDRLHEDRWGLYLERVPDVYEVPEDAPQEYHDEAEYDRFLYEAMVARASRERERIRYLPEPKRSSKSSRR